MSDEGSSHLGPDESVKRENAEQLLADVADVTLLLVGAYASKILPHLPTTLPPDFLRDIDQLGAVHGSMMDWAIEAIERAGVPQPHRPAGEAVPVFDFKRLNELDRQDVQALITLGNAWLTVGEAAGQLAAISPNNPAAQERARRMLGQAISELIAASARLMRLDAERGARIRAAHMQAHRDKLTAGVSVTEAVDSVPFRTTVLPGMEQGGWQTIRAPTGQRPEDIEVVKPSQVPGPTSSQGGVGPAGPL